MPQLENEWREREPMDSCTSSTRGTPKRSVFGLAFEPGLLAYLGHLPEFVDVVLVVLIWGVCLLGGSALLISRLFRPSGNERALYRGFALANLVSTVLLVAMNARDPEFCVDDYAKIALLALPGLVVAGGLGVPTRKSRADRLGDPPGGA